MRFRPKILLGRLEPHGSFSVRQLLGTTPGLVLISFVIIYLFALRYYHYASYRDPTSYFFDPSRAYERLYSNRRMEQAGAFVAAAANLTSPPPAPTQPPVMCVGVATVARREEQYVRSTVGSLLEGLSEEERRSIYLDLLIAHTEPSKHPIYSEKWIEILPNNVLEYKNDTAEFKMLRAWEEKEWYRNKTIFDYTYLLNDCYATGAKYIAMVEDDTLAVAGWFPRAMAALHDVEVAMERREGAKWIYLRLFFVEDLFGWNSEEWLTYLLWSLLLWGTLMLALVSARRSSKLIEPYLSDATIFVLSCICFPSLIGLYFLAGRSSLSAGIQQMDKYGCCSQGYIFPRSIVPELLKKTDLETDWLVDMMFEQIANAEGYIRWATVPALLQHIGIRSSKGYGFDNSAGAIWNFGFELHDPPPVNQA